MKFSIEKQTLLNTLQLLSKAVLTRSTLPIIGCALFTQKKNKLSIRTTDLEISINMFCNIEEDGEGSIAIPLTKLLEITNAMPKGKINFSVSDIGKVSIDCEKGHYTIMGQSHEEFPAEQIIEKGTSLTINGKELKNIIKNTTYATSRDDLKPVLQGVLFKVGKEGFVSVATDGHRLVKYEKTNIQTQDYIGSIVVPAKFLILLDNQLEDNDTMPMLIGKQHIQIELASGKIISRIIKEPYPDYEGVIPKDNSNTLIVDKNLLEEAIKRVSIFSNKSSRQISLKISDNNIIISTEDPENITSGKETLECDYDGAPITIGYNALYLREVLQHQNSSEIKIMLESPLNAGLFLPIEQNDNEHKTTLLMPIRLND